MKEQSKKEILLDREGLPIISPQTKEKFFEQVGSYMKIEPNKIANYLKVDNVLFFARSRDDYHNYLRLQGDMSMFVHTEIFKHTPEEFTSALDRVAYEDLRIKPYDINRPLNRQAHEAYIIGAGIVLYMFNAQCNLDLNNNRDNYFKMIDAFGNKSDTSILHEQQQLLATLDMFRPMYGMFGDDIQTGGRSMYKALTKLFPILHRP